MLVNMSSDNTSILLERSAADDLEGFRFLIENEGFDVDDSGLWYGRSIGSKKMKLEERTPLMIASLFGSKQVLKFILGLKTVDVNKACGSDRATALHMAVAGGCSSSVEVIELLLDASADPNCLDVHGNRPADLVRFVLCSSFSNSVRNSVRTVRKRLEIMLNGGLLNGGLLNGGFSDDNSISYITDSEIREHKMKKEYPVDLSLPDMKNAIYNTDEFRMYAFKIKPCSRAYSHDWTECPFVHPGENARRRDPRKYHYTCVPCPEFRKGSCRQGDSCEYAHGIFECWLHPAQYRTRLCKDEIGCNRKVCFFAHKPEELRPLHPSTGSAVLSPRSLSDVSSISPFSVGPLSVLIPQSSTPPVTHGGSCSSPRGGLLWSNQSTPSQKVFGSRFRTAPSNQDLDLEAELMLVDRYRQQRLMDEFEFEFARDKSGFAGDYFEENDISNMNYHSGLPSSPLRRSSSQFGPNPIMNSRSAAFAKRSQSFVDRPTANRQSVSSSMNSPKLADWGSPDGKLNWGFQKDELNKFQKSASFGVQRSPDPLLIANNQKHDVTFDEEQHFSPWLDQDQLVA